MGEVILHGTLLQKVKRSWMVLDRSGFGRDNNQDRGVVLARIWGTWPQDTCVCRFGWMGGIGSREGRMGYRFFT